MCFDSPYAKACPTAALDGHMAIIKKADMGIVVLVSHDSRERAALVFAQCAMLLDALFLFDLLVSRRAWCGYLYPVGTFYGLISRYGRLKVKATPSKSCDASACSRCMTMCPEPQALAPVVSKQAQAVTSVDCTSCGACLDECHEGALSMKLVWWEW